jgi:phage baseplate assembly protein W
MTVQFARPLYGFKFAQIRRGDTLQNIAARELGDGKRWYELISYNKLIYPYLVDDAADAAPGVLVAGSMLLVPAPAPAVITTTAAEDVFQVDIGLTNGTLNTDGGDFVPVSGRQNLEQAIVNVIGTSQGEIIRHMAYGSMHRRYIGAVNGPTSALLVLKTVTAAIESDSRISSVTSATATSVGDALPVVIVAQPVAGDAIKITAQT